MLRPMDVPEIPAATAALARKVHPQGTDEMRVRDALGPLFRDMDFTAGEFAGMYASRGQPGLSPTLLLMVTILQFRHNLSDREAAEAVADRISWKYSLGPGTAPLPKSGGVGLTLWQLLDQLQVLLACWAGACPLCKRPAPRWLQRTGRPSAPT